MRGTTPELALAAKQESCIPPSPRLFKERLIYEQSAARTVREQQEKLRAHAKVKKLVGSAG